MPGLGPRSARRIVLHMLRNKSKMMYGFADLLQNLANTTQSCQQCNNIDIGDICKICNDHNRDQAQLCIVEEVGDLWNIEKSGCFHGIYYVMGKLTGNEYVMDHGVPIEGLLTYIQKLTTLQEVIIANNPTVNGQTAAFYIADMLTEALQKDRNQNPINITTLGKGVPMGSELDYLDEGTIGAAFRSRKSLE